MNDNVQLNARFTEVNVEKLEPVVQWPEHLEQLAQKGVSADELERAKKNIVTIQKLIMAATQDAIQQGNTWAVSIGYFGEGLSGAQTISLKHLTELYQKAGYAHSARTLAKECFSVTRNALIEAANQQCPDRAMELKQAMEARRGVGHGEVR